jgi:N-acetylgalactosamine kinase
MQLNDLFARHFPGKTPTFLVEAPGRVNLIGEHTDYNGYPVMPMAVTRAIRVLFAPRTDNAVNAVSELGSDTFELAHEIPTSAPGSWVNYVKAAHQGIIGHFGKDAEWTGLDCVVLGDVPTGAGLSSSSALVVASALALMAANGRELGPTTFSDLMANSERYVGTAGGGMDQAVCIQAREGHALRIGFYPLTTRPVRIPDGAAIVIANSLVTAEKSGAARLKYNRLPLECRIATRVIAGWLARERGCDTSSVERLADIPSAVTGVEVSELDQMILGDILHDGGYTASELTGLLGMDAATLDHNVLTLNDGVVFPEPADGFRLRERVRHVLTEADRVDDAADALEGGDLARVGNLMNASHASCRDDYHISTVELDTLTEIMREEGAFGARLTGAGFGGCAVALIPVNDTDGFIARVRSRYYDQYLRRTDLDTEVIFSTTAGPGARVTKV